ncbi:MAG TPA: AAA family ATPase [Candidatus Binatia bacterium]|nr:AAA family ATPase [Candidatus Binatia bacterium]
MYNSYFGFIESPFRVTPDPRFFYTNPVYQEAYANLRYGIEAKKGFIVMTGEVGTGKTTLLRKLMRNLEGTISSVFVFNTYLSFPELLQLILHDLGLAPKETNKIAMLQELNEYLIEGLKQRHIVAVLIDEAQSLSDESLEGLRLLSNLETDQEKLLQIVLIGQPELEVKLDQPQLRQLKQRVALQGRLAPLGNEEVGPYIEFRLQAAGYTGKDLFPRDAVQQIGFYSKGIPRVINTICDNALLNAYARSQKTVSADVIAEVARDLRLEPESEITETKTPPAESVYAPNRETPIRKVLNELSRHKGSWMIRAGVGTFAATLVFLALASIIDPQTFLSMPGNPGEVFKRNLNQWVRLITRQEAVPKPVSAQVELKPEEKRVTIQSGETIYKIATDAYGANSYLGLNLIKEFNPTIKDLNWVFPGQDLLLPPLTQETMLRKQPDGSYRLIVAAFPNLTGAHEYARLLGNKGYRVAITPKRVSNDLLLHQVEIDGLKNLEEANRVWDQKKHESFAFFGRASFTASK